MPAWKKVIVSGSAASFASIQVSGNITASIVSASQFTGSLFGSSSYALTASYALNVTSATTGANRKLTQSTPSTTWSFAHNLGERYPVIETYDTNGASIIPGRIETIDTNNLFVYFDDATAGTVVATVGGTATTTNADTASYVTGSIFTSTNLALSASYALTASYALNGGSGTTFPYNGNAVISGSLVVTGSTNLIGNTQLTGALLVTKSYISTIDYIDFTVQPDNPPFLEGRVHWNDEAKTLELDTDVNNFYIPVGHANVLRGRNTNSSTLTKGSVVYINGNSGQFPTFATASWETDPNSAYTIGILAQDINSNQYGYAITDGEIRGINTNNYAPSTLLYLSSSGQITDQIPLAPLHTVRLGQVVVQSTDGIIQVKIDNGYEIGELHDVVDTNPQIGDLLVRSGSSPNNVFKNSKQLTGSYGVTGSWNVLGNVSATSLTGSITASSLQGAILNTQLQNNSVTVGSTNIALGGTATTIAGIVSLTTTNLTSSIISASNFISGGQIIAATGFTGSLSASFLKGAILNSQLQNSSVTVGSTNISLGGTATTIAGLTSLTSTGLTGSLTASSLVGDIILGTQTSGQYASTITAGLGMATTATNPNDATAYTVTLNTSSAHFLDGVKAELNTEGVISGSVSSPSQGTISVGGFTNIDLGLQTGDNVTFNNITSTGNVVIQGNLTAQQFIVSSSVYFTTTSFSSGSTIFGNDLGDTHQFTGSLRVLGSITGSISASNLVGDIILGTQTSGQYASTITGGSGLTATAANANDGTAYTIDVVAGLGISLTAPTNDAINIDTGSAHFTGGVTNRLNTLNVLSGSVSSPSQGTISVGGFANIDLGLQSGDDVTFNRVTATNGLTGSLTASSLIGDIRLGAQTSGDYVQTLTQGTGVTITSATGEGSNPTIAIGQAVATTSNVQFNNITASIISASNHISGGQIIATTGFTGSLSASFLKGAILNSQLQNSSVTIGNTAISLGGTATTITGLTSVTSTNFVGTASYVTGSIHTGTNPALSASYALTASFVIGGVGSTITIADEGTTQGTATFLNFTGNAVTATVSSNTASLTISTGSTVSTVAGTTNQVSVNGGTAAVNGAVTISLPSTVNLGAASSFTAISLTGSLTASSLQGAILNTQLQNSSVTVGSTNIALGGTATTIAGLTSITSTGLTGSLTASSLQGAITNAQLQNSSVTVGTTAISLGGSATTIAGIASLTSTNITASIVSASNFISGGQIIAATGFTGSLSASFLKGAILNSQLQNSSVTIGNTAVSLGGTATTITGLTSVTSTNFVGTASYVTGSIFNNTNPVLSASYALTASYALNGGGGGGTPGGSTTQIQYNNGGSFGGVSVATFDGTTFRATGSFTGSFKGDGSGLTNLGFGDTRKLAQDTAATTWSFTHNMAERYPVVTVYDNNNNVIVPGRIESVDENTLKVYFKDATAGTAVASVGGNAVTASYISNAVTIGTTNLVTEVTSSLGATTTTVSRVWTGSYSGAFWEYVVNNSTNFRAGTVMGVWNKIGSAQFTDTSTPDIGDTSQLTFGVVINGEYAELRATATTSGWNVKTFKRSI